MWYKPSYIEEVVEILTSGIKLYPIEQLYVFRHINFESAKKHEIGHF